MRKCQRRLKDSDWARGVRSPVANRFRTSFASNRCSLARGNDFFFLEAFWAKERSNQPAISRLFAFPACYALVRQFSDPPNGLWNSLVKHRYGFLLKKKTWNVSGRVSKVRLFIARRNEHWFQRRTTTNRFSERTTCVKSAAWRIELWRYLPCMSRGEPDRICKHVRPAQTSSCNGI